MINRGCAFRVDVEKKRGEEQEIGEHVAKELIHRCLPIGKLVNEGQEEVCQVDEGKCDHLRSEIDQLLPEAHLHDVRMRLSPHVLHHLLAVLVRDELFEIKETFDWYCDTVRPEVPSPTRIYEQFRMPKHLFHLPLNRHSQSRISSTGRHRHGVIVVLHEHQLNLLACSALVEQINRELLARLTDRQIFTLKQQNIHTNSYLSVVYS